MTDTIDQYRQNTLTKIFVYLRDVLERYKDSERICHREIKCNEMILSSLTIDLNAIRILQSSYSSYNNFSVKDVFHKLREMKMPQYCQNLDDYERDFSFTEHRTCEEIKKSFEVKVEKLRQKLQEIELTIEKYN